MKEDSIVNNYKYNKCALKLATSLFVLGVIYGIATHKGALGTLGLGFIGSLAGFTIASFITLPTKIN